MDWFITCQTVSPDQRQEAKQSEYRKMHFGNLVKHYVTNGDISENTCPCSASVIVFKKVFGSELVSSFSQMNDIITLIIGILS